MREALARRERPARGGGEPFVLRYRVPRETLAEVVVDDLVYGQVSKSTPISRILLCYVPPARRPIIWPLRRRCRSQKSPTSCAARKHLANTFKHISHFEALGFSAAQFRPSAAAHRARRIQTFQAQARPRGQRHHLSRMPASLPQGFINFVVLRGWSPKDNREVMSRQELIDAFSLEGIHHSNRW